MTTIAIGDCHAHPKALELLLNKLAPSKEDTLVFIGDLVGKGPDNWGILDLIFNHIATQVKVEILMGNHDLYFLGQHNKDKRKNLTPHQQHLIETLVDHHHFAYFDTDTQSLMTHAGIWPSWSLSTCLQQAQQTKQLITEWFEQDALAKQLEQNQIDTWSPTATSQIQTLACINVFTRMRCLHTQTLSMDLNYYGPHQTCPDHLTAWFDTTPPLALNSTIQVIFGHWAALNLHDHPQVTCIDHGFTYGKQLSAYRPSDKQLTHVSYTEVYPEG